MNSNPFNINSNIADIIPRGNDDKYYVDRFFEKVVQHFNTPPVSDIAVISVNHMAPTLPPYQKALEKCFILAGIIPKGSAADSFIMKGIEHLRWQVTREELSKKGTITQYVKEKIGAKKFILIDIGGYFGACIAELAYLGEQFLGIVEDTENGHQVYEKIDYKLTQPIVSVARSQLKKYEDFNVGKSIVHATETIMRDDMHTIIERQPVIGVMGFGKIGSSGAKHLKDKRVQRVIVYDISTFARMEASSLGFEVSLNKKQFLNECDIIFCMTGKKALIDNDFLQLKDNVIIASCTSNDTEFDLSFLKQNAEEIQQGHVTIFKLKNGRIINFLHGGNAVNFVYKGVNGPFIYGVQAALIVSALRIAQGSIVANQQKIQELSLQDQETIASFWIDTFERKNNKKIINLPDKNKYFTGRTNELKQISGILLNNSDKVILCNINGLSGMGKSQLAKEFSYDQENNYQLIWWFDISRDTTEQFKELGKELNQNNFSINLEDTNDETIIKNIYDILSSIKSWLFIFDNVDENKDIKPLIPLPTQKTSGHIILTSQYPIISGERGIALSSFSAQEAKNYISKCSNDQRVFSDEDCKKLADALDNYPLLLSRVIAYLLQNTKISISTYIENIQKKSRVKTRKRSELPTEIEDNYQKKLRDSLKILIDRFKQERLDLLYFITLIHPENIPESLLHEWGKVNKKDELKLIEAINALEKYKLIEKSTNYYRMHRLIRAEITQIIFMKRDDLSSLLESTLNTVLTIFGNIKNMPLPERATLYNQYTLHLKCIIEAINPEQTKNKKLFIKGVLQLAKVYFQWHEVKKARSYYEQAKSLLDTISELAIDINEDSLYEEKIITYSNLGKIYTKHGLYNEAKNLLTEVYQVQSQNYPNREEEALALLDLAKFYQERKLVTKKIIKSANRAYEIFSGINGVNKERLVDAKLAQASAYGLNKQYEISAKYLDEALNLQREILPIDDYKINLIQLEKADLLIKENKHDLALPLLQDVLRNLIDLKGVEHPHIRLTVVALSQCFFKANKLEEGRSFFNTLQKKTEEISNNPSAVFLISLAQGFQNLSKEKSVELYEHALSIKQTKSTDEFNIDFSTIYSSMAYLMNTDPTKLDKSIEYSQKALEIKIKINGDEDITVATEYRNMARTYLINPEFKKYEPIIFNFLDKAHQIDVKKQKGYKISQSKTTLNLLISACEKFHKPEKKLQYETELNALIDLENNGKKNTKRPIGDDQSEDSSSERKKSRLERYQQPQSPAQNALQLGAFTSSQNSPQSYVAATETGDVDMGENFELEAPSRTEKNI